MDAATRNGWLIGGGGAVCAAAFAAILYQSGVFSPPGTPAPAPQAVQTPLQPSAPQQKAQPVAPQAPAKPQSAAVVIPSFDVVRVEPNGDAVIAGRAAPGAKVTLMISGKPGGQAQADTAGQFVILPQALPPGAHDLSLQADSPQGAQASKQTVAVSVPAKSSGQPAGEVVVALAEPDKPTVVLSEPAAVAPAAPAAAVQSPQPAAAPMPASPAPSAMPVAAPPLRIESVEADESGGFYASGQGVPGRNVRLYLNGAFVADVTADVMGRWSLRVSRGLQRGKYAVRADALEGAKVSERAEVEFDYAPAPGLAAAPPQAVASPALAPAPGSASKTVSAPQQVAVTPAAKQASTVSAPVAVAVTPPAPAVSATPATPAAVPAQAENQAAPQALPHAAPPASNQAAAHVVIEQLRTASVVRGDSLWRISRRMLGQGVRYTQIFAANTAQLRNPHRIYPGQVLVVPNDPQRPAANGGG